MIREFKKEDYDVILKWWEARNVSPPSLDMLSDTGYVYEHDGEIIAVTFIYLTNSNIAFVEWVTTRPYTPLMLAREATTALDMHIVDVALRKGCEHILGWVKEGGMIKESMRLGYELGSHQTTHVYKKL